MTKKAKIAILLPVVLIIIVLYQLRPVNLEREYGLVTPELPTPNGYDDILKTRTAFSATSNRVGEKFEYVDELFGGTRPKDKAEARQLFPTARKVSWIQANTAAFSASEQAIEGPFVTPPKRMWKDESEVYSVRFIANCWRVKAKAYAETGQPDKAMDMALKLFKLSSLLRRDGEVTTMLMGNASEAGARDIMTSEIAKLNSAQATKSARQLEKILLERQPLADHFEAERNSMAFEIHKTYQEAIKEMQEPPLFADENQPAPTVPIKHRILNMTGNFHRRLLIKEYVAAMDEVIGKAGASWQSRQSVFLTDSLNPKLPHLISVVEGSRFLYEKGNVNADLMLTRLALHGYRKAVGNYPETLVELTPKYLAKVPVDAFSSQPMRYRREGKSYKLWSVGPDSRDDNARPALNPLSLRPASKYLVRSDSGGDIVANINN